MTVVCVHERPENSPTATTNFIEEIITRTLAQGKNDGRVHTRFPPEPNGYLHIGHAKSICLTSPGRQVRGQVQPALRRHQPRTEDVEYVESRGGRGVAGFRWNGQPLYASDYFDEIYRLTEILIENGKAYVDDLSAEQISEYRGNFYKPARTAPSATAPWPRISTSSVACAPANLPTARACCAPRSLRHATSTCATRRFTASSGRTTTAPATMVPLPMYDYAHPSPTRGGITHSICTLEFEDHRAALRLTIENLPLTYRPRQIEFARLNRPTP